ncbi:MAG: ABC transporter permease [Anaerolineae bacterium]|jgi:ABC-type dipeptide/oligopeptide/nickel transport system permease subunit|nr:ABC transporter permease [Anaerolineae bacterium]
MKWLLLVLILIAPIFAPYDPMTTHLSEIVKPPSVAHPMGTDHLGRDVWSRWLYGGQHTLIMTALATLIGVGFGTLGGLVTRYEAFAALWEGLMALPGLLLSLVLLTLLGASSLTIAIAVGIAQIAPTAIYTRNIIKQIKIMAFVEGTIAIGASEWWVMTRTILPNAWPSLRVYAVNTFGYCLLNSAALAFLGFTGQPGLPDWGVMMAEGNLILREAIWVSLAPGIAITVLLWLVYPKER